MKIKKIKIIHPAFNRKISVLMIDNKIDHESLEFLLYVARYGGHKGGIIGIKSHDIIAKRIAELYYLLDSIFNLKWHEATEIHLEKIRDMMVGESNELVIDSRTGKYKKPIRYESCDDKMRTWFNFYMYMKGKDKCDILLNYREQIVFPSYGKGMNSHLDYRTLRKNKTVKIWALLFNKKTKSNRKYALSKNEFNMVCKKLREIDLVYEIMALFAVETALRIDAIMKIDESEFNGYFNVAQSRSKKTAREYLAKYNKKLYYEMSLEFFKTIKQRYLTRELSQRLDAHYEYCKGKRKQKFSSDSFWIRKDGKRITENDFRNALSNVSKQLGRSTEKKITPHIFRHTAATWKVIEISNLTNINLKSTGYKPPVIISNILQRVLGHSSEKTVLTYIATAIELMEVETKDTIIRMPKRVFLANKHLQSIMLESAKDELGKKFNEKTFNLLDYCINNGSVVEIF